MRHRVFSPRFAWTGLLLAATAFAAPMTEQQKINALIQGVETLQGVQFVRNGSAYDGKAAAAHLRYKQGHSWGHCDTANDFIAHCASGSSMSGKPYRIRFADGREVDAEVFFHDALKRIETPLAAPAPKKS